MDRIQDIHKKAVEIAGRFRQVEADLISILQEVEETRAFIKLGYTSLFSYCVQGLRLSESVASNFVTVSRKAREIPMLQSAIREGLLGVSKARKITSVLTTENQEEWLKKAQIFSSRQLEQEVAKVFPQMAVSERLKFVAEDRLELRMGISKSLHDQLNRVQDLESQRTGRSMTLEETLEVLASLYLEKKDPLERARRVLKKKALVDAPASVTGHVPAGILHRVRVRDLNRCTHKNSQGIRCESRRWIHVHHVKARALGGQNTVENLTLLCSAHHRMEHWT